LTRNCPGSCFATVIPRTANSLRSLWASEEARDIRGRVARQIPSGPGSRDRSGRNECEDLSAVPICWQRKPSGEGIEVPRRTRALRTPKQTSAVRNPQCFSLPAVPQVGSDTPSLRYLLSLIPRLRSSFNLIYFITIRSRGPQGAASSTAA